MTDHWLKIRREQIGISSQGELARLLSGVGIARKANSVSGWENGNPIGLFVSPDETRALADILKWSVPELLSAYYDITLEPTILEGHELSRHQIEAVALLGRSSEKKQKIIMKMVRMLYDDVLEDISDELLSE